MKRTIAIVCALLISPLVAMEKQTKEKDELFSKAPIQINESASPYPSLHEQLDLVYNVSPEWQNAIQDVQTKLPIAVNTTFDALASAENEDQVVEALKNFVESSFLGYQRFFRQGDLLAEVWSSGNLDQFRFQSFLNFQENPSLYKGVFSIEEIVALADFFRLKQVYRTSIQEFEIFAEIFEASYRNYCHGQEDVPLGSVSLGERLAFLKRALNDEEYKQTLKEYLPAAYKKNKIEKNWKHTLSDAPNIFSLKNFLIRCYKHHEKAPLDAKPDTLTLQKDFARACVLACTLYPPESILNVLFSIVYEPEYCHQCMQKLPLMTEENKHNGSYYTLSSNKEQFFQTCNACVGGSSREARGPCVAQNLLGIRFVEALKNFSIPCTQEAKEKAKLSVMDPKLLETLLPGKAAKIYACLYPEELAEEDA